MADDPRHISEYSIIGIMNPEGKNEPTSLVKNFYERKKFKEVPYYVNIPPPMDLWYDKLYFGRVDRIQNGIILKQQSDNLKQLGNPEDNVFALNFVADAFNDLQANLLKAGNANLINKNHTVFYEINATKGLHDFSADLRTLRNTLKSRFHAWIASDVRTQESIVDFYSYIEELRNYLKAQVYTDPITRSGYVTSNSSSPLISGLVIEVGSGDCGDDKKKFDKFMRDPNFNYFAKAARKYGFLVDRNAPWRLIADPFSLPMLGYLDAYGVNEQSFFATYYHRTFHVDLENLREDLRFLYNEFVLRHPHIFVTAPGKIGCRTQSTGGKWSGPRPAAGYNVSTVVRKPAPPLITYTGAPALLSEASSANAIRWLDLYFKIRLQEEGITFTNYKHRFRQAVELYGVFDFNTATRFINNEIKPYLYNLNLGKKVLTSAPTSVRIGSVEDQTTVATEVENSSA